MAAGSIQIVVRVMNDKGTPMSNAEKQAAWRRRSKQKAAKRLAWIEFMEKEIGPDEAADMRLRFLAQWQFNETD